MFGFIFIKSKDIGGWYFFFKEVVFKGGIVKFVDVVFSICLDIVLVILE